VAVSVTANADSEQWQSVLTAELSKSSDIQIAERAEYARLLREREEMALKNTSERQLAPLPNIAYYLHFRETSENNFLIEAVSAESGKLLASTLVKNGRLDDAAKMAASAQELLKTAASQASAERTSRIAVIEPAANEQVFILAARLSDALKGGGFTVLDRALTQEVVVERNEADRGQRDAIPENAFLGADYFLQLVPADGDRCELRLVNVAKNQLVATQTFINDSPEAINGIQKWLFPLLGVPEKNLLPYSPSASVEALQPFYRGLRLFDEGKYIEATEEFTYANVLNGWFREAFEWEARCYDALGLPQLADAVRRYRLIYVGGKDKNSAPDKSESLAFLGVHGGDTPELRAKLTALAANALAARRNVHFSESLAQTCREYDWLVGLANTDGNRWESSPSLFCRTTVSGKLVAVDGKPVIRWFLRDTLEGPLDASAELVLSANSKDWPEQIEKFFDTWPGESRGAGGTKKSNVSAGTPRLAGETPVLPSRDIAELERALRRAGGLDVNAALLRLLLADPANPLIGGYSFEKNKSKQSGVEAFMNAALRDYCIGKLPEGDPHRRWLELRQIYMFIGYDAFGRIVFGEKHEFVDLLKKFIAANGKDAPGLVARYSLIFDTQGKMPYPELIKQCNALVADLRGVDASEFPDAFKLERYTESIRRFACIANGDTSLDFWTDFDSDRRDEAWKPSPYCIRLAWSKNQRHPSLDTNTPWLVNEMCYAPLTPEEKMREAQAAIAFNGRGNFAMVARDEWLEKWPRSLALTTIVSKSLQVISEAQGLPSQYPFDGEKEVASYRRQIDYLVDSAKFWLERIEDANELKKFERYAIEGFILTLISPVFFESVSDEEFVDLQRQIVESFRAAEARVGRVGDFDSRYIPWQTVTREQARRQYDNVAGYVYFWRILNRDYLQKRVDEAQCDNLKNWWEAMREWDMRTAFTNPEIAEMALRQHKQALALAENANLGREEWGYLFEQALALLRGGRIREAEELFEKIQNAPAVKNFPADDNTATVQANIAYRLVHIYRANGRLPESMQQAQLGLKLCENRILKMLDYRYDEHWRNDAYQHQYINIANDLTLKLGGELQRARHDPTHMQLPDRVKMVTVSTPQMDNPTMNVHYRVPIGADPAKPCRVLLSGVSLEPNGEWARFADEHNLVLINPQFRTSEWIWHINDSYCTFSAAQAWSGQVLLDALDKIDEQCPIQKDNLMLLGRGMSYALRVARWRPDLVAAVAMVRPSNGTPPRFYEPGLQPLSALRNTAIYLVGAELDNNRWYGWSDFYDTAVHFATLAQAAGVPLEWKNYPDLVPSDPQEVEDGIREFFARQLAKE